MSESKYYNADKLLNMKDLDGLEPSLYLITTNRCAGKTTHFLLKSIETFKTNKRKTALVYRHQYELSSASSIFKSALKIYDNENHELLTISHAKGMFYEFMLDGESFAFAVSLSNVDALKKYSPLFTEVDMCIMDEFQKEDGIYLKNEVQKLQSLLISIARGGGEQSRPIKMFLLGNDISMFNPYFVFFEINKRFKEGTKFIRGRGWIAEFNFNESASKAIKANGLFRAFEKDSYMAMSADNKKLFNEDAFIEKCVGKTKYLFTIKHDGKLWGVREELATGKTFINEKADSTCKTVVVFTSGQHATNTIMLNKHSFTMKKIKESYELGLLRFSNLNAKNVIYDILAIDFSK